MLRQWPHHVRSYCEKRCADYEYYDDETEFLALKGKKRSLCVRGLADTHSPACNIENPEKCAAVYECLIHTMLRSPNFKPRVLHGKVIPVDPSDRDGLADDMYLVEGTYTLVLHMCE